MTFAQSQRISLSLSQSWSSFPFLTNECTLWHFVQNRVLSSALKPVQTDLSPQWFSFLNLIGVYLIYNIVLVSGILQSDSVIHIHICILLENLTSYKLSQNIEFPALYSRSLLVIYLTYSSMYMFIPSSWFIPPWHVFSYFLFGNHDFAFDICSVCLYFLKKFIRIIFFKELHFQMRTRWQRNRWMWSTSLSKDTSGLHLQTQKCMQNTSWEWTGVPDQWKRIYRTMQNSGGGRS